MPEMNLKGLGIASSLIGVLVYADEKNDNRLYDACLEEIVELAPSTFNALFNSITATKIINQDTSVDQVAEKPEEFLPSAMNTDLCMRVVKAKSKAPVALAATLQLNEVVDMLSKAKTKPSKRRRCSPSSC